MPASQSGNPLAQFYDFGLGAPSPHDLTPRTLTESDAFEIVRVQWGFGAVGPGHASDHMVKLIQQVIGIGKCESTLRTDATSDNPAGGTNVGWLQIWSGNVMHPEYLKSPQYSVKVAKRIYVANGNSFKQWACASAPPSTLTGPGDEAVPEIVPGVDDPQIDVGTALGKIADMAGVLFQADTWFRVGKGALGGILVVLGTGALVYVAADKVAKLKGI